MQIALESACAFRSPATHEQRLYARVGGRCLAPLLARGSLCRARSQASAQRATLLILSLHSLLWPIAKCAGWQPSCTCSPTTYYRLLRGAAPRGVFVAVACRAVASVARRRAVEQRLRHKLSVSAIHIEVLPVLSVYIVRCIPLMPQQTYTAWAMPMARLSPSHDCSHVAASSHRRRCPFWSPLGARAPRPCSSKAVVYADSSCLARKVAVVSDISVGGPGRARDRPKGANLLYSFLCAA